MLTFLVTFIGVLLLYLLLVLGSGEPGGTLGIYFAVEEIVAGVVLSLLAAVVSRMLLGKGENDVIGKPANIVVKPAIFIVYLFPFIIAMAFANIDVAFRVITGKIRPGIVRIKPRLRTNLARTVLANSITLTPGTLTVDVDDRTGDFFIHWIFVKDTRTDQEKMREVCGGFPEWARRVAE